MDILSIINIKLLIIAALQTLWPQFLTSFWPKLLHLLRKIMWYNWKLKNSHRWLKQSSLVIPFWSRFFMLSMVPLPCPLISPLLWECKTDLGSIIHFHPRLLWMLWILERISLFGSMNIYQSGAMLTSKTNLAESCFNLPQQFTASTDSQIIPVVNKKTAAFCCLIMLKADSKSGCLWM